MPYTISEQTYLDNSWLDGHDIEWLHYCLNYDHLSFEMANYLEELLNNITQ